MCRAVAIMRRRSFNSGMKKGEKKGEKRGEKRGIFNCAINAIRRKMSFQDIQAITGLSLEKIASIAQSIEPSNA